MAIADGSAAVDVHGVKVTQNVKEEPTLWGDVCSVHSFQSK